MRTFYVAAFAFLLIESLTAIEGKEIMYMFQRPRPQVPVILNQGYGQQERCIAFGFTVRLIPGTNLPGNSIIPFNKVYNNEGGGYNTKDGKFYCPASGLYLMASTMETSKSRLDLALMKNGQEYAVFLKGSSSDAWGTGSLTVVVRLKAGDTVWIQSKQAATIGQISSFSGVLISS